MSLQPWTVTAVNLPEHARNAIHTDAGARAAGFPGALVAGVTTYAYLTHVPLAGWGLEWARSGGGEVRLLSPVFEGDVVECVPFTERVEATVGHGVRATLDLFAPGTSPAPPAMRPGEALQPRDLVLAGEWGADYGVRAGDGLTTCGDAGVAHPAVWPALANHLVHTQVARGSWIHLRSRIRHHALAPAGATATARGVVVERAQRRSGERAVLDVEIEVEGVVVATIEHEAIVALPSP